MTYSKQNFIKCCAALIAGAILPLAFAPLQLWPVAILSTATLLYLRLESKLRFSFLFGAGFFASGASWIFVSLYTFGQANVFFAGLITLLFILALTTFITLQCYLFGLVNSRHIIFKCTIAYPVTWVLFEILRSFLLSGFPWLLLGYSQITSPLRGLAPITSVYGISFAVTLSAGLLISIIKKRNLIWTIIALVLLSCLWLGSNYLAQIHWTNPASRPVRVSLVQGNISLDKKWDAKHSDNSLQQYATATKQHWQSKIIIWPENAVPTLPKQAELFLSNLNKEAKAHDSTIITGIPFLDKRTNKIYNGMLVFGKGSGQYLKRQLVPFGEYLPFKFITRRLGDFVTMPMADFSSGPDIQPLLATHGIKIAPFICYEITYLNRALDFLPQAQLLITVSDDSWFGRSTAAAQHLEIAQMRSLETGRYQLVSTNSGLTAIIRPDGALQATVPQFQPHVLTGTITPMQDATPLVKLWNIVS